ncbi:hypothetical protein SCUCBS95973_008406 [Sporothrix curviconia]|uniref:Zn(2)-C6 fungal-type domain-containing protein n=1 Tax=Sporothrix curviconia TaxID=1260050 RepID=A0ABP0CNC8_9PEZI
MAQSGRHWTSPVQAGTDASPSPIPSPTQQLQVQGQSIQQQSRPPLRRTRQLRLACARCQKRKIRCDGAFPVCRNCKKASASCVDGESLRLKPVLNNTASLGSLDPTSNSNDGSLIERLRKQISGLEAIIHAGLPEVDLSQDPLLIAAQLAARNENVAATITTNINVASDDTASGGPWTSTTTTTLPAGAVSDTENGNDGLPTMMNENHPMRETAAPNVVRSAPPPAPPLHRRGDGHDSNMSQIGLVSVGTSSDPHYIGPSSGYFLARMLLSPPSKRHRSIYGLGSLHGPTHGDGPLHSNINIQSNSTSGSTSPSPPPYEDTPSISYPFPVELVEAMQAPLPLPSREHCNQLCNVFFDVVNIVYPVLHRPSFVRTLDQIYQEKAEKEGAPQDTAKTAGAARAEPWANFQVFMVLALAATIQSRRLKARIPGELYCLSALQYFDRLNVENSLPGLQCLLLLLLCTMHCPNMRLNVWYLNYQCVASALDLGIQRNITTSSGLSFVEQEMRTRLFWVVLTLDRTIATMMGRPIGLRDEACDLRLPIDMDDDETTWYGLPKTAQAVQEGEEGAAPPPPQRTTNLTFAIHLFKLARLNSEIKYVANSVVRSAPPYAYPPVADIHAWRSSLLDQLDDWARAIPGADRTVGSTGSAGSYLHVTCQLRYHQLRMLLLRPSPAIPNPSHACLRGCYDSAVLSLRLLNQLYRRNLLVHNWIALHTVVLSTITVLYCLQGVPALAREVELAVLMSDIGAGLGILSASGEYWTSAKRCRDILEGLARTTMSWVASLRHQPLPQPLPVPQSQQLQQEMLPPMPPAMASTTNLPNPDGSVPNLAGANAFSMNLVGTLSDVINIHPPHPQQQQPHHTPTDDDVWATAAAGGGSLMDHLDMVSPDNCDSANVDTMMRALFEDFISNYTAFDHDAVL